MGLLGYVVVLFFLRNPHTVFHSDYQFTFPPTVHEGSLFFTLSPAFIFCRFLFFFDDDDGHYDWCEVVPHCSLDLNSLIILRLSVFSYVCWPSVYLL